MYSVTGGQGQTHGTDIWHYDVTRRTHNNTILNDTALARKTMVCDMPYTAAGTVCASCAAL